MHFSALTKPAQRNPIGPATRATVNGIADVARALTANLEESLGAITTLNREASLLSVNARVEASRAGGTTGAAFDVVAQAMGEMSLKSGRVAQAMGRQTKASIAELERISASYRGERMSDLALNAIDLIDRNLYERSCDVRWWATDESVVTALSRPSEERYAHASRRLGVILDSYTVYFDLVLCDLDGTVVANGRPREFTSVGSNHRGAAWFQTAVRSRSGAEFGFQTVHRSRLVPDQRVLVYSCAVRDGGESSGRTLGVLGIVFKWDALAQPILENVPLDADERTRTRGCIVDGSGLVLADTSGRQLLETLAFPDHDRLFAAKKNFALVEQDGRQLCVAHAHSPGFETYSTGWHSLLIYSF